MKGAARWDFLSWIIGFLPFQPRRHILLAGAENPFPGNSLFFVRSCGVFVEAYCVGRNFSEGES